MTVAQVRTVFNSYDISLNSKRVGEYIVPTAKEAYEGEVNQIR